MNEDACEQTYRASLRRSLERAHAAVAWLMSSRDKWKARALEAEDRLCWTDVKDTESTLAAVKKERDGFLEERNAIELRATGFEDEAIRLEKENAALKTKCAAWDKENEALRAVAETLKRQLDGAHEDLKRVGERYNAEISRREEAENAARQAKSERDDFVTRSASLGQQLAAANADRDALKLALEKKARVTSPAKETLDGVRFELDRAVRLGGRPASAMYDDLKRILALIPGEA